MKLLQHQNQFLNKCAVELRQIINIIPHLDQIDFKYPQLNDYLAYCYFYYFVNIYFIIYAA